MDTANPSVSEAVAPQKTTSPVLFSGKYGEFFGIWIVNLLLSIVTLGIYSAWAKVRTNQYFYGHTKIDGHSFRYLAKPMQILKGRIIAFVIFVLYTLASSFNPIAGMVLAFIFLFVMPWLVVQGLRFNMRMTSYRNVRFSFHGKYGDAFIHFILLPIVALFTMYLAMPWVMKRIDQFMLNNITYGGKPLSVNSRTGTYYKAAFAVLGASLVVAMLVVGVIGVNLSGFTDPNAAPSIPMFVGLMLGYWVALSLIGAIYQSMIRNHLFSVMEIEDVASFTSKTDVTSLAWLNLSNALIVVCTVGFGYPVAKIRKAQYFSDKTDVHIEAQAASIIDEVSANPAAFGEEAADFFDVDLSLA